MNKIKKSLLLVLSLVIVATFAKAQISAPPSNYDIVQNVPHGDTKLSQYYSTTVGNNRNVRIYTPPGYSKDKSYNVLYLMHGIGGDENEWNYYCSPNVILDNLFAKGTIEPMVVVFPNGRAMKDDRATGDIFAADKVAAFANFENDLLIDLIPYMEANYSVIPNSLNRALVGYSMGGGQSLNIGLRNLDKITWVGSFACAPNTKSNAELVPNVQNTKSKLNLLWLSCGSTDGLLSGSKSIHDYMTQQNIPHFWQVEQGLGHETLMWKRSLYNILPLLFKNLKKDCSGTSGGLATKDSCGVCFGGATGRKICKELAAGNYSIRPANSELCIQAGAGVSQQTCSSTADQTWTIKHVGNFYEIKNVSANKYISVASTISGINLSLSSDAANSQWRLEDAGENTFYLVPASNLDLVASVANGSTEVDTKFRIMTRTEADSQRFGFTLSTVTNLEDDSTKEGIYCYPNPFTHDFQIKASGKFEYAMYNSVGKKLENGTAQNSISFGKELPAGIYTIKIKTKTTTQIRKMIKN